MQTIKILSKDPLAISLWNAMCNSEDGCDVLKKFSLTPIGDDSEVVVKVLVNDVEVDLVEQLREFVKHIDDQLDKIVEERALELLQKDDILWGIKNDLERLDWKIRERIAKLQAED